MWLDVEDLIEIHDVIIRRFGGTLGVRDKSLLDSAIKNQFLGYYEGIFNQAAVLFYGLIKNHAFVDGNKRTALAALDIFLKQNSYKLDLDKDECLEFLEVLLEGAGDQSSRGADEEKQMIYQWIEANTIDHI